MEEGDERPFTCQCHVQDTNHVFSATRATANKLDICAHAASWITQDGTVRNSDVALYANPPVCLFRPN